MRPFLNKTYPKGQTYQDHLNRKPPSSNPGQDISTPIGIPIYAPTDCYVANGIDGAGGLFLVVKYANVRWVIVHLSKFAAKVNVKKGTIIGYTGNTGNSTGPHTHFTLYIDGKRVDPMLHFPELFFNNNDMTNLDRSRLIDYTFLFHLQTKPTEAERIEADKAIRKLGVAKWLDAIDRERVARGLKTPIDLVKELQASKTYKDKLAQIVVIAKV